MQLFGKTQRFICMVVLSLAGAVAVTVAYLLFTETAITRASMVGMVVTLISQLLVVAAMTYSIRSINRKIRIEKRLSGKKRK